MGKYNLLYVIAFLIAFLSCDCNYSDFEADWIIVDLQFKGNDFIDFVAVRNMRISSKGGVVARFHGSEFKDTKVSANDSFKFSKRDNDIYINIAGSIFFTDEFRISCLNKACCEILLENKYKSVRCVYNGPLSPLDTTKNCQFN